MNDSIQKLADLIRDIKFVMFTTVDVDGTLYSRPMACQNADFDGELWFLTSRSSGKIRSLEQDQNVNLCYMSPQNDRYISVSGQAQLVSDRAQLERLWEPSHQIWFPLGVDDPDLIAIKVQVLAAEYWDSPSNMIVKLVGFAKSMISGQPPQVGEHQKVNLTPRH